MSDLRRWRGLRTLIEEAVEHGSRAVERVQIESVRLPFAALERIPRAAAPARALHALHDTAVTGTHVAIRLVSQVVGVGVDLALDAVEHREDAPPATPEPREPTE